jgi:gas vesicle protein
MDEHKNKFSRYILGGLVGAVIGMIAAYLIERSADFSGEEYKLTSKKLSKVGLGTISLLWSLLDQDKKE